MKTNKLINKILLYYLTFGFGLLLLTVPLFHILYEKHYAHEIEEYLVEQRDKIDEKSLQSLHTDEIPIWNRYNDDKAILPDYGQRENNRFVIEHFYDTHERKDVSHHVLYSKIRIDGKPHILTIRLSAYETEKIIRFTSVDRIFLFTGLMVVFMLVTRLIYKRLWRPFFQTISQIEQFNVKINEMPHFHETNIREFVQLNKALEKLAENSMNAYKIQKEFTENASHEMQTPLAVFSSKLDVLIQQPDLTKQQMSIIQSLYDTTARMSRINKNLLLLAKIDNLQFADVQNVNMTDIINESLLLTTGQASAKNLHIESRIIRETCRMQTNRTLAESLVNNLMTNAVKHNTIDGRIVIAFDGKRLSVSNTGVNHPLDEKTLFIRFGQTTGKTKGCGLGLAIVHQICALNKWNVNYSFHQGLHNFSIIF